MLCTLAVSLEDESLSVAVSSLGLPSKKEEEKNVFKIKFLAVNPTTFVCRHDPNVLEVWNFISVEKWSKPLVPIELDSVEFWNKKRRVNSL